MKEFIEKLIGRLEELKELHEELIKDGLSVEYHSGCKALSEDAIEIVNELAEEYNDKDCSKCSRRSWYQIGYADAEKKFAEEYKGGWIPCSERLPDNFMSFEYLTTRKGHTLATISFYCVANKKWYLSRNSTREIEVIAWQPLPQSYQPKGE